MEMETPEMAAKRAESDQFQRIRKREGDAAAMRWRRGHRLKLKAGRRRVKNR